MIRRGGCFDEFEVSGDAAWFWVASPTVVAGPMSCICADLAHAGGRKNLWSPIKRKSRKGRISSIASLHTKHHNPTSGALKFGHGIRSNQCTPSQFGIGKNILHLTLLVSTVCPTGKQDWESHQYCSRPTSSSQSTSSVLQRI